MVVGAVIAPDAPNNETKALTYLDSTASKMVESVCLTA